MPTAICCRILLNNAGEYSFDFCDLEGNTIVPPPQWWPTIEQAKEMANIARQNLDELVAQKLPGMTGIAWKEVGADEAGNSPEVPTYVPKAGEAIKGVIKEEPQTKMFGVYVTSEADDLILLPWRWFIYRNDAEAYLDSDLFVNEAAAHLKTLLIHEETKKAAGPKTPPKVRKLPTGILSYLEKAKKVDPTVN